MAWGYLPVLHRCITILLTIVVGYICGRCNVFDCNKFVDQMIRFVFYIALPSLILEGLGTNIDFYDESNYWSFIGSFLLLRLTALVMSLVVQVIHGQTINMGQVAIVWLCLSWISTVIFGIPIISAIFNEDMIGQKYGILAGVSSFFFQLPLQLLFLEYHVLNEVESNIEHTQNDIDDVVATSSSLERSSNEHNGSNNVANAQLNSFRNASDSTTMNIVPQWRELCSRVGRQLLHNPVIWVIVLGFVLSLSTFGTTYLNRQNDYGQWFASTLSLLGACTSPLSLFAMGVWMSSQRYLKFPTTISAFCLISKLIIIPLVMVGIAQLMNLNYEESKAAVLIAALPISMASFSLGNRYQIGEEILSENVTLGTLLLLPTVLMWNIVIDSIANAQLNK